MRTTRMAALPLVAALLLTGCVGGEPEPPTPLAEEERLAVYQESLDQQWTWVTERYPDAEQPDFVPPTEIQPDDWEETIGVCLEEVGLTIEGSARDGFAITPGPGLDGRRQAIGEYACYARYPSAGTMESLLSVDERDALYRYYLDYVSPCLGLLGERIEPPPSREEFVAGSAQYAIWHPYYFLSERWYDVDGQERVEQLCPREPAWRR